MYVISRKSNGDFLMVVKVDVFQKWKMRVRVLVLVLLNANKVIMVFIGGRGPFCPLHC